MAMQGNEQAKWKLCFENPSSAACHFPDCTKVKSSAYKNTLLTDEKDFIERISGKS